MTASIIRRPSTRWLAALALLATAPGAVRADPPSEPPPTGRPAEDVTRYSFDDDLVRGDLQRPDGEVLHVRRRNDRESLIRVRTHFVPELLKSGENL